MYKIDSKIDYIGSKTKLAPTIAGIIERYAGDMYEKKFVELFAGTAALSRWFLHNRTLGKIITNDFEFYAASVCVATTREISVPGWIYRMLNNLPGYKGFISETCSPQGSAERMYFTDHNARLIDGMKAHIELMYSQGVIDQDMVIKLCGELVIAADKVSNTASVYGAYLKQFKKTAMKRIELKSHQPGIHKPTAVWNLQMDANEALRSLYGDVLYIDPPYNSRQYGSNYHVLNYIADLEAEKNYKPTGKTGLHRDWKRSKYCSSKRVAGTMYDLLENADFEYVVVSYNNNGILPISSIKVMACYKYDILEVKPIEYPGFKADNGRDYKDSKTTEYVIVLRKKSPGV